MGGKRKKTGGAQKNKSARGNESGRKKQEEGSFISASDDKVSDPSLNSSANEKIEAPASNFTTISSDQKEGGDNS